MRVLVTGAAGLLGGELCARLVAAGHQVTALVRNNREIAANDGTPVTVDQIVTCDVAEPLFGLGETAARELAQSHDLLVHCAATIRFDLTDEEYARINIGGTKQAIELCRLGDMGLLHVSTAYVCGTRNGPILEAEELPETGFANGYEASKAQGERLVRASDIDWAIARPSIVTGDSSTGAMRRFDTIYLLFKLMAEGRLGTIPAAAGATLDLVPVDHVGAGLAALVEHFDKAVGGTFHLSSSDPLPFMEFVRIIGEYEQFVMPEIVPPDRFDVDALAPLERRIFQQGAMPYASYLMRDPRFDDRELRAVTGLDAANAGADYFRLMIRYACEAGFLKPARQLQRMSG